MTVLVIGSEALSYYIDGIKPNDLDLVATWEDAQEFRKKFGAVTFYPINSGRSLFMKNAQGRICEVEIAWEGSRAEKLLKWVEADTSEGWYRWAKMVSVYDMDTMIPSLNVLYMLKMSHRYLKDSPHFLKTMRDIRRMRELGCTIPEEWMEFYKEREKDTYTYKHPNLNVEKGAFFDTSKTGVFQKYDHDSIHRAVSIGGPGWLPPAYTFFLDGPVKCSKEKFDKLDYGTQLMSVVEEAMVLALERSLVPHPGKKTPKEAFDMALMKVCTSITSGWWREFAWENYYEAQEMFSCRCTDYVQWFEQGVADGTVKLKEN